MSAHLGGNDCSPSCRRHEHTGAGEGRRRGDLPWPALGFLSPVRAAPLDPQRDQATHLIVESSIRWRVLPALVRRITIPAHIHAAHTCEVGHLWHSQATWGAEREGMGKKPSHVHALHSLVAALEAMQDRARSAATTHSPTCCGTSAQGRVRAAAGKTFYGLHRSPAWAAPLAPKGQGMHLAVESSKIAATLATLRTRPHSDGQLCTICTHPSDKHSSCTPCSTHTLSCSQPGAAPPDTLLPGQSATQPHLAPLSGACMPCIAWTACLSMTHSSHRDVINHHTASVGQLRVNPHKLGVRMCSVHACV